MKLALFYQDPYPKKFETDHNPLDEINKIQSEFGLDELIRKTLHKF